MEQTMKFSIVVIGHNQKESVCNAVHSAVSQTYRDIEVIYVDDASSDGSAELVERKYGCERLQVIRLQENQGPLIARMTGISHASGQWVLFLDGDDYYDQTACAVLADTINRLKKPVEVIGFGVQLIYKGNVSDTMRADLEKRVAFPYVGALSGNELLDEIYIKGGMSWNIANKCFSMGLLQRVQQQIHHEKLYASEDFYMNFLASHMAQGYFGIANQLYCYTIGGGISTSSSATMQSLQRHMTGVAAVELTEQYADRNQLLNRYQAAFSQLRHDLLYSSYYKLMWLSEADRAVMTKLMFETFGTEAVMNGIADGFGGKINETAKYLDIGAVFPVSPKPIRTVGMYYYKMYNGGVERVIQLLTPILQSAGYNVVVITDEPITDMDYPLPEHTARVVIGDPGCEEDKAKAYAERLKKFSDCIREHQIDVVIYHAWLSERLFFDMCAIKQGGAACVVHSHGVFFSGMNNGWTHCIDQVPVFRYADGLVALSEVDKYHWSAVNRNVHRVNNPLTFAPENIPKSKLDSHNVVWVGRFDPVQKNPFDILHIFSEVCKSVPDAKLYLVGTGEPYVVGQMEALVKQLNIAERVVFTGYTSDVSAYLSQASAYLFTSNYEGYSMAYAEALSHGLPVVTYPLPYMTMAKDSKATIHVGWKDIQAAANALVDILTNDEKRLAMGAAAREEAAFYGAEDLTVVWKRILTTVETGESARQYVPTQETVDAYHKSVDVALQQLTFTLADVKRENAELQSVYSSKRYRLGALILNVPAKILQTLRKILKR